MKKLFFALCLLFVSIAAHTQVQPPDTLQTYSTEGAACIGFEKSAARYRDQSGQSRAVVADKAGRVYLVAYSCKRGYYREPLTATTVASAD